MCTYIVNFIFIESNKHVYILVYKGTLINQDMKDCDDPFYTIIKWHILSVEHTYIPEPDSNIHTIIHYKHLCHSLVRDTVTHTMGTLYLSHQPKRMHKSEYRLFAFDPIPINNRLPGQDQNHCLSIGYIPLSHQIDLTMFSHVTPLHKRKKPKQHNNPYILDIHRTSFSIPLCWTTNIAFSYCVQA